MKTDDKIYYKRNLPHYQLNGLVYFVTFRLANSIPFSIVEEMKKERELFIISLSKTEGDIEKENEIKLFQSKYFGKYEAVIDNPMYGPVWLNNENIAKIVYDTLLLIDGLFYDLYAFSIMPNHVHLLIKPRMKTEEILEINVNSLNNRYYSVAEILRKIKGTTARQCNIMLNRQGSFWQHESYDHVVRNMAEQENIVKYILNNPIKIKLADKPENYRWNYCNYNYL